jgi:hypothetical protein
LYWVGALFFNAPGDATQFTTLLGTISLEDEKIEKQKTKRSKVIVSETCCKLFGVRASKFINV